MDNDPDERLRARRIIEMHGAAAASVVGKNARGAALAGQPVQARSWIRVLDIVQRRQAAPPAVSRS